MSTITIIDAVRDFLVANFPDASIDDDYCFVSIRGAASRRVTVEGASAVAQKMCDDWCWVVGVNVEGISELFPLESETRTITYQPNWNVQEPFTQQLARVPCPVDLGRLRRSKSGPSALVLISPTQRIVLDLAYDRVHAPAPEVLSTFLSGLERFIEPYE